MKRHYQHTVTIRYLLKMCITLHCIGNHAFAVIQGNEDYDCLKNGLAPVLNDHEVNHLIDVKLIEVNDVIYELNVVLGGDYKVKLYILINTY